MCTSFRVVLQVCLCIGLPASASSETWTRVAVSEPLTRHAVYASLDAAVQWFNQNRCRALLSDFNDRQGCPLADRLAALNTTFDLYLQWIVVRDADGTKMCAKAVQIAFTAPGSRVVFVCGKAFLNTWQRESERATAVLIHEVLHTLGLGENGQFPSSREITRIVLTRCAS